MRKWMSRAVTFLSLAWVFCTVVPEALAFPHHLQIGDTRLYSETLIPEAAARTVLARSDQLLRASQIAGPGDGRRIFLTDGGWRWLLLAPETQTGIAISRPVVETIIINRSDVVNDDVVAGVGNSGRRSLSGVITHERTHGLIRAHFGLFADWRYPVWLREGYCDLVAGGGTLSDSQAAALKARGQSPRALVYYDGRKRAEARLERNGGSVDRLFAEAGTP